MSRARRYAYRWLPALVVFVASIAFWELLVHLFDVQNFLLPAPSDILATLRVVIADRQTGSRVSPVSR